jgi:hypothetical protein
MPKTCAICWQKADGWVQVVNGWIKGRGKREATVRRTKMSQNSSRKVPPWLPGPSLVLQVEAGGGTIMSKDESRVRWVLEICPMTHDYTR